MATTDSRPDWMNDNEGDEPGTDPAILADIDRIMRARGYTSPNGQQQGAPTPAPASNTATDPAVPTGTGADAGTQEPSANAGAELPPPTGGAVAPGGDASQTLPPPAAGTELPPPATPEYGDLVVRLPSGDPFQVSQDQANYLIQLHQWLESKPQALKDQWRQIEEGTAQVLPTADFQAYQAWVQAGRPTATQPAPQRPPFDPAFVTPEFLAYVEKLEDTAKTNQVPVQQVPQQPVPGTQFSEADIAARATAEATRRIQAQQAMDQSLAAVREKYSLSPELVAHLQRVTPSLNIIPAIADRHRQRSPFGDVMSEAPVGVVFTEAFETAMTMDPTLRAAHDEYVYQQRVANEEAIRQGVAGKKAAAGSVATAPSAAVPSNPTDIAKMTPQQRREGMLAELTELWGTGQ